MRVVRHSQMPLLRHSSALVRSVLGKQCAGVLRSLSRKGAAGAAAASATSPPAIKVGLRGTAGLFLAAGGLMLVGAGSFSASKSDDRRPTDGRLEAVKERLKGAMEQQHQQQQSSGAAGSNGLQLVDRPDALHVLAPAMEQPGLYMVCGPKGEGKTSLMQLLEQKHPLVIRVDLQKEGLDEAVRALASAIGFHFDHSAEEHGVASWLGFSLPCRSTPGTRGKHDLEDFQGLLLVFEKACIELREEGALKGQTPVLILDHADRVKLPDGRAGEMLRTLVGTRYGIGAGSASSWVVVTGEADYHAHHEYEAETKAGVPHGFFTVRVPAVTETEARLIIARTIATRLKQPPTPEVLCQIEKDYNDTFKFAIGAVGMRARLLEMLLAAMPVQEKGREPGERKAVGVKVASKYHPFLPKELHELLVHPQLLHQFGVMVEERRGASMPLLTVDYDFELPPSPQAARDAERTAKRVLAFDGALRELVNAAKAEDQGTPVGLSFQALQHKYFRGHEQDLSLLCKEGVLFYDPAARTVAFESDLMRRIVEQQLKGDQHTNSIELVCKLLESREAKEREAEGERQCVLRMQAVRAALDVILIGKAREATEKAVARANEELAKAQGLRRELEAEIRFLRRRLRLASE